MVTLNLGINDTLIHRWRRDHRHDGHRAMPGNGSPRDEEIARLKRESLRYLTPIEYEARYRSKSVELLVA